MDSQNLKNSYQVNVMSKSESVNSHEKSQESLPSNQENFIPDPLEDIKDPLEEENEMAEGLEEEQGMTEESSSDRKDFSHKKKEQKVGYTAQFEAFKKDFEDQTESEAKLQLVIQFMEASLAQGGTPHFRSFWEARRLCLPLFKENISPALRAQLWTKYSELSKEARRLKEILDEQSAFAVEQIEIAIQALENDISQFSDQIEKTHFPELLVFPQSLNEHYEVYQNLQKKLNILNTQASRINALRKELLRTEMRVKHKNKFFQCLSAAGDKVFPNRKELIKQISQQFSNDVDQFIQQHFGEKESRESFYVLREEIKAFQGLAKVLTLNTHSFTQTRTRLSECWDRIKVEEKERKKERAQQRIVFKQNAEEIDTQIQALKASCEKNEESVAEVQKKMDGIVAQMRKVELGRDELKVLREGLNEIRKLMQEKTKLEEDVRHQEEKERHRQKKEKYQTLKIQAENLLQEHESQEVDALVVNRDDLLSQIHNSTLSKSEKQELERIIKPLRDVITDKKEKALLALSEDDRHSLQQMKTILTQRKERRQEIKNQLEILRKASGSSSLDFEKAMNYTSQINEEKERLEKANQAIQEIELKISELQAKIRS